MRVRVKVCGLRRVSDARAALDLGASLLGCVLAKDSPRQATIQEVLAIREALQEPQKLVLVFRGSGRAAILQACAKTGIKRVQVHGGEEWLLQELEQEGLIPHRVHRVPRGARSLAPFDPPPTPDRPALLDGGPGGGGLSFDWSLLQRGAPPATYIAGGITPENAPALLAYRPFGIDVSSGIEAAPGVKDLGLMERLFAVLEEVS